MINTTVGASIIGWRVLWSPLDIRRFMGGGAWL